MKKPHLSIAASVITILAGVIFPFSSAQAELKPLVTCINLLNKVERISTTGKCIATKEAQANWHLIYSDSSLPDKATSKQITICSNKPTSNYSYNLIRMNCSALQLRRDYYRSTVIANKPTIVKVVATSHDSARVSIAEEINANPDAPVAYYTITSSKGQSKKVFTKGELDLTIDKLSELTDYSFNVTATTADGTSPVSDESNSVKTQKYVAPIVIKPSTAAPVAQVSLLSSDTASVTIPAGATLVAVAAPALLNPSISFSAQSAGISAVIQSTTNPVSSGSTPFTVSGSTKIVDISVTGLSGSATVCLDASPTAQLWHFVGGVWFDITSSRTSTQVCGSTSTFSPFTSAERIPTCAEGGECAVGDRGPGGGIVFYVSTNTFSSPGSTCNTSCKYLEVAPAGWNDAHGAVAEDPFLVWSNNTSLTTGQDLVTASAEGPVGLRPYEKFNWKIGQGFYNTSVMKVTGATSAAQAAVLAYAGGSMAGQWFIPSMNELNELCKYAYYRTTGDPTVACPYENPIVRFRSGTANDREGFVLEYYWSSTEFDSEFAWFQYFPWGTRDHTDIAKSYTLAVRPVRAF